MSKPLRILSYNIRKAVGLDGRRQPGRVLDVINRLDGDIVLLQEADKRLGARPSALPFQMIDQHSDFQIVPVAENDVSLGWHGNAVLVRRGLTILDAERLDLPGLEPRGAVIADIATPNGSNLTVVGAHLGLLRPWRRKQLATISDALRTREKRNTIVAGDFNEWSGSRGLETLSATHSILSPGKSFHANRPMAALDRIAHDDAFEMFDAGVDQSRDAKLSSDHLPIWSDLQWRT